MTDEMKVTKVNEQKNLETSRYDTAQLAFENLKLRVKDNEPKFDTHGKAWKVGESLQLEGTGKAKTLILQSRADRKDTTVGLEITHGANEEIENLFPTSNLIDEEDWALLIVPAMLIVVITGLFIWALSKASKGEAIHFTKSGILVFIAFTIAFIAIVIAVLNYVWSSKIHIGIASQIESSYTNPLTFYREGEQFNITVEVIPVRIWHPSQSDKQLFGHDRLDIEKGIGSLRETYNQLKKKLQRYEERRTAMERRKVEANNKVKRAKKEEDEIMTPLLEIEFEQAEKDYQNFMERYKEDKEKIRKEIVKCEDLFTEARDHLFKMYGVDALITARESLEIDHEVERAKLLQKNNALRTDQTASEKTIDGQRRELTYMSDNIEDLVAEKVAKYSGGIYHAEYNTKMSDEQNSPISGREIADYVFKIILVGSGIFLLAMLINGVIAIIDRINEVGTLNIFLMVLMLGLVIVGLLIVVYVVTRIRQSIYRERPAPYDFKG